MSERRPLAAGERVPVSNPLSRHARQREPEGRSTAQSAAKPARSAWRGREDYGRGWAGRFNQNKSRPPLGSPPLKTCAAARARRAKPAQSAAKREQSEARGREDYGRGWAGRFNQNKSRPPLGSPPLKTCAAARAQGRSTAQAPPSASKARRAAGRTTGGGGRGGSTKTNPGQPLTHPRPTTPRGSAPRSDETPRPVAPPPQSCAATATY